MTDVFHGFGGASSVPDATTTQKGKVELATQTEAEARTDATRAVTPAALATFALLSEVSGGGTLTQEEVQDFVDDLFVHAFHSNISATYDDANNRIVLTGASAGGSLVQNTQTGTSYTLVLADEGKVVEMNNASANTLTVPPNSSVAFPIGAVIEVYRMGAGSTTVVAGSGVTVRNAGSLRAQYSTASLRKRATDEWVLAGDLS